MGLADAPSSEMAMPCCSASRPGDDAASHKRAYLFLFFVSLLASWILRDRVAVTSSVVPGLRLRRIEERLVRPRGGDPGESRDGDVLPDPRGADVGLPGHELVETRARAQGL